ncbi:alpha-amylase family glycosyl hydrolase, partial [Nocardioides massiliensis]
MTRRERAPRVPTSTYRFQVNATQDLPTVARRMDYLNDLGIDWVYLSPILPSEPGSDHGYDVVAHDHVDAARGGEAGLDAVAAEAHKRGMGVLVDIVPNHVGVATPAENAWWWDLLKHGQQSAYAKAFDVDWEFGGGKIRIPVIGDDDFDAVQVDVDAGEVRYHDNRFPLAPGSLDKLDHQEVLAAQHYELVHWKVADDGLNYRRFFAVNTLAAVRVEDPQVFADTHVEIERWFAEGLVDGLRVDHPDGLRDPAGYLRDLAELTGDAYVLVEKILETGEELPVSWATEGTTGYDVMALVDRVLVDPGGVEPLTALETRLRGGELDWESNVFARKLEVADGILRSEVRRIVREIRAVEAAGAHTVPEGELEEAVAHVLAAFPVYRSYLPEGHAHLHEALERARIHTQHLESAAMDVVARVLGDPE